MRLCKLALAAAHLLPIFASQAPLSSPSTSSTTLVDILSADPDYTSLIRLLQRARLIPTLNSLNGSTLFAPTNHAVERHASSNPLWHSVLQDDDSHLGDNVNEELRQQLFYHLLNYTLPDLPSGQSPSLQRTLHFPRKPPEPPTREPPPSPPWMPTPGGTLGGAPQRLRIAAREKAAYVGVDAFGNDGVRVVKQKQNATNGVVYGIEDMLIPPPDLAQAVSQHPSLSYFRRIINPAIIKILNTSTELTLFLPVDPAWKDLDPYERLYLESGFAADDLLRILNMHAVIEKGVRWSDTLKSSDNLKTLEGTKLEIEVHDGKTKVSSAELSHPDIYASNGVLHLVSALLIPPNALRLTPEKYLLALNCTKFVSLLHSVDLQSLVNDTETKLTILAPRDDVLSAFRDTELPDKGTPALRRILQYHFIPGKWMPQKVENGMLIETMLVEEGLNGGKQVIGVEVNSDNKKEAAAKTIRFGGAGIIGDPVDINSNILIYFVARPIIPPADPLETALPHLDLSSFLAAIFSISQADLLRKTPLTTLLLPHNAAFKRLGLLVSAHLLSPSARQDLENVVLHHAIKGVEYARSIQNGSQHTFATLEGSDIQLDRLTNGSVLTSASGGWSRMKSELFPHDLLTQTGVIHELSDILIPRTVQLTVGKLVKAAKASTMSTLVLKAGFEWVLNGTAPPEDSPLAGKGASVAGWTLLCPTDDAFKKYDLDALYADRNALQAIVQQHLIPVPSGDPLREDTPLNNNQPLPLVDSATYSTLYSTSSVYGDIVFRQREEEKDIVVGIKGARGTDGTTDWARVSAWGRSTTGGGTGGVIQIDRPLMPYHPSWWVEYGAPSLTGVIGVAMICLFFYGVRKVWRRDTTEATYEPVGGYGRDDDA
ncbi:FAS1 domain containing protein [Amanita muscaria]